jgi:hypothetical protein
VRHRCEQAGGDCENSETAFHGDMLQITEQPSGAGGSRWPTGNAAREASRPENGSSNLLLREFLGRLSSAHLDLDHGSAAGRRRQAANPVSSAKDVQAIKTIKAGRRSRRFGKRRLILVTGVTSAYRCQSDDCSSETFRP